MPCPSSPSTGDSTATVSCGFLGLQKCPAPGSTGGSTTKTVSCGFLNLQTCPAPADPPPPPSRPDPGGNETSNASTPPPSGKLFGFNTGLFGEETTAEAEVALERNVGANAQRYAIHWRAWQPSQSSPPIPNLGHPLGQMPPNNLVWEHDEIYLELTQHNMTPILVMADAPPWATKYASCFILDLACMNKRNSPRLYPDAAHIADWKRFVAAVAARYPKAVIEPWNEPNVNTFWASDPPDAVHMAKLQCAAYQSVKALTSPNKVISPGLALVTRPRAGATIYQDYVKGLYANGLRGCMDGLSVHPYSANVMDIGAGSPFAEYWSAIRDGRTAVGDTSPIWVTETGSMSDAGWVTSSDVPLLNEAQQSDLNQRLYNRMITMPDVKLVGFHTLRNAPTPEQRGNTSDPAYHFGFIRENWEVKPVFCAFVAKAGKTHPRC
jgi:hypothetical protein